MGHGITVGFHLNPRVGDEADFVALALGNLTAFRLQKERGERLEWQVVRVEGEEPRHYRLVIRHPQRLLDFGFKSDLRRVLEELSQESQADLTLELSQAKQEGLRVVPLRHVKDEVDFWQDDFWNWIG
jgi:hypothetical protein